MRPAEVAGALTTMKAPWWIAGGWAIDLFLGRQTRPHADTDVLVLRHDQLDAQRALSGWQLFKAACGRLVPWLPGEHLPVGIHDVWCRPNDEAPWRLQLMLAETDGGDWVFRREPSIRLPIGQLERHSAEGLSYLCPEVQLLFKAKEPRSKDDADFEAALPHLDTAERTWLMAALECCHPGHRWLGRLAD